MKIRYAALFSLLLLCFCSRAQYQQDWLVFPSVENGEDVFVDDVVLDPDGNTYVRTLSYKRSLSTFNYYDHKQTVTKVNTVGTVEWQVDISDTYLPQYNYNNLLEWRNGAVYTLTYAHDSIKLHCITPAGNHLVLYGDTVFNLGNQANYQSAISQAPNGHLFLLVQTQTSPSNPNRIIEFDENDVFVKSISLPGTLSWGTVDFSGGDKFGNLYVPYLVTVAPSVFENHVIKYLPDGSVAWDTILKNSNSYIHFQIDSFGNFYARDSTHFIKFDTNKNAQWSYFVGGRYISSYMVTANQDVFLLIDDLQGLPYSNKVVRISATGSVIYSKLVPYSASFNSTIFFATKKSEVFFCSIHGSNTNIINGNGYSTEVEVTISKMDTLGAFLFSYVDSIPFPVGDYPFANNKIAIDDNENVSFNYRFRNPQGIPYPSFDSIYLKIKDYLWFSTKYCTSCRHNIVGDVRLDTLSNCIADSAELAIDKMLLRLNPNEKYAFSNLQGKYRFAESDSGTHTVTILPPDYFITPCDTQKTFTLNDTIGTASPDFVLQINPDCIGQLTTTGTRARYGFTQQVNLRYRNTGYPPQSGFVSLQPHSNFSYVGANPPADSVSGNTYFWHFNHLQLFETMQVNVSLHVNLFINNAFSHIATANTGCVTGMVSATDTLHDVVFGSYDPNDKNVWPLIVREHNEFIADTQTLTYQINFQNTGNDTAFRVAIRDTLSQYLDISTIKMIAASHAYDVQLLSNQTLEWVFNNILLPDSHTNEPLSHGYVRFSIKPKKGIALNTVIENKAAIYFDYNDPIITNTVALQYVLRYSGVSEATEDKRLKLYPNPASDNLIIQTDAEATCEIFIQATTGEIVFQEYAPLNNATGHVLNISKLPSGLYIVAVRNSNTGQMWYRKFCKL